MQLLNRTLVVKAMMKALTKKITIHCCNECRKFDDNTIGCLVPDRDIYNQTIYYENYRLLIENPKSRKS